MGGSQLDSNMASEGGFLEYKQAALSPYQSEPVILNFGASGKVYTVPHRVLTRYRKFMELLGPNKSLKLDYIPEDIAHTIVHWMYTRKYQTIEMPEFKPEKQYELSVRVYCAATRFAMHGLASKAREYIRHFEYAVNIFQVLAIAASAYHKVPANEPWYATYLEGRIADAFDEDEDLFKKKEFMKYFGRCGEFDSFLMRVTVSVYSNRISKYDEMEKEREAAEQDTSQERAAKRQCRGRTQSSVRLKVEPEVKQEPES